MANHNKTLELIESITEQFAPEQIKALEVNYEGKTQTFRERMIVEYGNMYIKTQFLSERFDQVIMPKLLHIENRLNKKSKLTPDEIDYFIKSFDFLFQKTKIVTFWNTNFKNVMIQIITGTIISLIATIIALVIKK